MARISRVNSDTPLFLPFHRCISPKLRVPLSASTMSRRSTRTSTEDSLASSVDSMGAGKRNSTEARGEGRATKKRRTSCDSRSEAQLAVESLPESTLRKLVSNIVDEDARLQTAVLEAANDSASGASKVTARRERSGNNQLSSDQYNAKYVITAPYLVDQWPDDCGRNKMVLQIAAEPSSDPQVWASFNFHIIKGVLRSCVAPPYSVGQSVKFEWCGREMGEMTVLAPDGTDGEVEWFSATLTFLGDGKIQGTFGWERGFEFTGSRENRALGTGAGWQKWKNEWQALIDESEY
ncbi:hypothetical protein BKA62DRAFT_704278 [Auriculariales sp. MPI-PUGE-AT-0066]|nr:hypothetical protein BKA62DRAFT_704278 [Auriculariales sp. MPI-PUGE-AT-0066]